MEFETEAHYINSLHNLLYTTNPQEMHNKPQHIAVMEFQTKYTTTRAQLSQTKRTTICAIYSAVQYDKLATVKLR